MYFAKAFFCLGLAGFSSTHCLSRYCTITSQENKYSHPSETEGDCHCLILMLQAVWRWKMETAVGSQNPGKSSTLLTCCILCNWKQIMDGFNVGTCNSGSLNGISKIVTSNSLQLDHNLHARGFRLATQQRQTFILDCARMEITQEAQDLYVSLLITGLQSRPADL